MSIRDFVGLWYRNLTPLEITCISMAIRDRQWDEFKHNPFERVIFHIISRVLKPFSTGVYVTKWLGKLPRRIVCLCVGHQWYPTKEYGKPDIYFCQRCIKIVTKSPYRSKHE